MSALELKTSLLQLGLRNNHHGISERAFLALAESLPEIKALQRIDLTGVQVLPRPCLCYRQDWPFLGATGTHKWIAQDASRVEVILSVM
jgi:hypothetical protein